jgi:hypothetical protein
MTSLKYRREMQRKLQQAMGGLGEVGEVEPTNGGHLRIYLRRLKDRALTSLVIAASPSCQRGVRNAMAQARRWARGERQTRP